MDSTSLSKFCLDKHFLKLYFQLLFTPLLFCTSTLGWRHGFLGTKLTPVIETSDGLIQGAISYSRNGLQHWEFLGIPYSKPPTGHRKFLPPEPVVPWTDIRKVTQWPPKCAQFLVLITGKPDGQLDCLYLNVFVGTGNNFKKPVIVFVHPGAFQFSSGSEYLPDYFMDHDIVYVTLNYRLGPYGYLNLEDSHGPHGNMGLWDLHAALKWVQKNIVEFKGDPDKVTLQGSSAGAVMTHLSILSPVMQGLFHKAVIQSGSAMATWGFCRRPRKLARQYAMRFGCSVANISSVRTCYENMPWQKLVSQQVVFTNPFGDNDMFPPSIDGKFFSELPENILASGKVPKIPVMFGVNGAEGGVRSGIFDAMPNKLRMFDKYWKQLLPKFLFYEGDLTTNVAERIKAEYFSEYTNFMDDRKSTIGNITRMVTDSGFFYPVHMSGYYHAINGAPTYMYFYNYTSKIYPSFYSAFSAARTNDWLPTAIRLLWTVIRDWISEKVFGYPGAHKYGVVHQDDILQQFNLIGFTKWLSGPDSEFSRDFVKAIVDFASGTQTLQFRGVVWPAVTIPPKSNLTDAYLREPMSFMLMDDKKRPEVIAEPFINKIKFWRETIVESDKYI